MLVIVKQRFCRDVIWYDPGPTPVDIPKKEVGPLVKAGYVKAAPKRKGTPASEDADAPPAGDQRGREHHAEPLATAGRGPRTGDHTAPDGD